MTLYNTEKANKIADANNSRQYGVEDDWEYKAVEVSPGRAKVEIYDEDGIFVANMGDDFNVFSGTFQ